MYRIPACPALRANPAWTAAPPDHVWYLPVTRSGRLSPKPAGFDDDDTTGTMILVLLINHGGHVPATEAVAFLNDKGFSEYPSPPARKGLGV
jgi:hypothetical protein